MEAYIAIMNKEETKSLEQEIISIEDLYYAIKASWENITDEHFYLIFKEKGKIKLRMSLPQENKQLKQ